MTFILFIAVIGLLLYVMKLNGRVQRLEQGKLYSSKPTANKVEPSIAQKKAVLAAAVSQSKPQPISSQQPATSNRPNESFDSHSFINLLPKVGIVALVIGLGFFLKYAIDEGWISVTFRLIMGGTLGTLLLILFYFWRNKYEKYAMVLAGGGLAIWYLTVWAAVQLYGVISPNGGMILLTLVTLFGVLLGYATSSKTLSALSWGGAYLIPIILSIGTGQYGLLLTYLTFVSSALMITVLYSRGLHLFLLALFGSLLNVLWVASDWGIPGQQYLSTLAFLFINLFIFSIVFVFSIRNETKEKKDTISESAFGIIAGLVYGLLVIPIVILSYDHFREFAPLIMVVLGVWIFIVYTLVDRLECTRVNYIISGLGAIVFSLAIFWHFAPSSEIIMLYILGIAGLVIGRIQNRVELRSWSLAVMLAGIIAALMFRYESGVTSLLLNEKFGLEILGAMTLLVSYFVIKRDQLTQFEDSIHSAIQYMIAILVWLFVSWDLLNYFNSYVELNQRNLSLSIWWLIYAIVLMAFSSMAKLKPLRKLGLFLIGMVIVKVFLYDVQSLDTVYRIISFVSLGAMLLGFSFIYQHNKEKIKEFLN